MMTFHLIVAVLALGTIQNPSPTSSENPAASPPAKSSDEITVVGQIYKENRRVCVSSVPTGSIMKKKICKTVAQWEQEKGANKRLVDRMLLQQTQEQLRAIRCMKGGGGPDC